MSEKDALNDFDFSRVSKPGKFLKFEAGKPVTIRILTKDPIVSEVVFKGSDEGVARFNFIVWNFTDELAQIISTSATMAKTFQRVAKDEDFGANLQKCDIKISPEGEQLERVYDINVLRHSGNEKELTKNMIQEARELDLDKEIKNSKGRLSEWEPSEKKQIQPTKEVRQNDIVIDDIGDDSINLDEIPF